MINPLKISEMLSQAGQMQEEVQRKLGETVVEASTGGGAVTATMNGKKNCSSCASTLGRRRTLAEVSPT